MRESVPRGNSSSYRQQRLSNSVHAYAARCPGSPFYKHSIGSLSRSGRSWGLAQVVISRPQDLERYTTPVTVSPSIIERGHLTSFGKSLPRLLARCLPFAVLGIALSGCVGQTTAGPAVQVGAHSVTLTWDASPSPVGGYVVYRATEAYGPFTQLDLTLPGTTQYMDTAVEDGHTYFYMVTSFDTSNQQSVPSNEVSATIPSP
jgi:hypothetical protein